MTDDKIRAVEQLAVHPAQRLIIAQLAMHAARPASIQHRDHRPRPPLPARSAPPSNEATAYP
jgi:hypothetical protein